ncbi:unnamed protein product, partial [Discosporangium mesarthrocarpum]
AVYVSSCLLGATCKKGDHYPSKGNAQATFNVSAEEPNIFIAKEADPSYPPYTIPG